VAQLAGIPKSVVAAAKRKLVQLENNQVVNNVAQPDMFMASEPAADLPVHPVISELEAIQADDLTPKQALDLLYKFKELVDKSYS
jgi:DNA mismatch repair protein MutS